MRIQAQFLDYIQSASQIIAPLNLDTSQLSAMRSRIETTELIVPVVGGFSAGKSTLINSFLGVDILPTAVTPETALATELRYSTSDYIEAIDHSGSVSRHDIAAFGSLKDNAHNFKNLRLYLNNAQLQAIQPLVLVDMPGFDAPIENHNQAILNYLHHGVYFVFLTSVEDGNITLSMKREIQNIQQFGKGFAFCISKTNLRPDDDVQAVRQKIAEQLADDFDHTDPIVLLDANGGNNLQNILQAINPEALFYALLIDDLRGNYQALTQSINVKISAFKGSKQDTDEAIAALQSSLNGIEKKKQAAIADVELRYSRNSVAVINREVTAAILAQKSRLVDLAMRDKRDFEREFNDVFKNALLNAVQTRFQAIGQDLMSELSHGINAEINALPENHLGNIALDVLANNSHILTKGLGTVLTTLGKTITSTIASQTLKLLVGGVFGIMGAVLVFLPEIISLFNKGAKERQQRAQIEQAIINQVIPQVQQKLNEMLPEMLNQQITVLINQISEQFESQLQQKRNEIQAAEAEKAEKATELANLIAQLQEAQQQLTQLANQHLFAPSVQAA